MKIGRFIFALSVFAVALPAHAAEPKLIGTFQAWDAFTLGDGNAKVCYMATSPKKSLPGSVTHGTVYVTVAHKPGRKISNEVNVVVGYRFKADSTVKVNIGGTSETLFTAGPEAWAYSPEDDRKMVDAMKRGVSMTASGTSNRGTNTSYEFSLYGFTNAFEAISKACGV